MLLSSFFWASIAIPTALAAPNPLLAERKISKRCTNSAEDRSCWGDYDLSTNYYDVVPDTGVTREYWFDIQNGTVSPDGIERIGLTVNGSFPGPTIIADWGDTVRIHVSNSMQNNGTGIHFHGIRQNYTNYMDGVPSVTQCPIAPSDSFVYEWRATQYGSSWYHSHFYVQAWDGVAGGIIINGPATANYDEDLGNLFLSDWSHETSDVLALEAAVSGPPTFPNCLINGTNTYTDDDGTTTGTRFTTNFVAGKRYRIRLVNAAADTHFRFTIDNHTMEVISTDFVPIVPYNTTDVSIGMGQRYDIIVTASETTGDFWMRSIPQESCSDNDNVDNILGIVRYDSTSTSDPTTSAYTALTDSCDDEAIGTIVPYLPLVASTDFTVEDSEAVTLGLVNNAVLWYMGGISFLSQWDYPTILAVAEGNDTWTSDEHIVQLPNANEWVYFVISTIFAQAHPIHLHGHDFWVLAQGTGTYSADTVVLTTTDSPRRDVAMLPANGYMVIALYTDNPGAWLMHCHIAWHTSEGFALQLLERESEMVAAGVMDVDAINSTCTNWDGYVASSNLVQDDSGV